MVLCTFAETKVPRRAGAKPRIKYVEPLGWKIYLAFRDLTRFANVLSKEPLI